MAARLCNLLFLKRINDQHPACDMPFHKFKIGQRVSYRPSKDSTATWYIVTALLPERNGEFKYRVRRQGASMDLVVGESELRENRER
jgi:hypothetical protein